MQKKNRRCTKCVQDENNVSVLKIVCQKRNRIQTGSQTLGPSAPGVRHAWTGMPVAPNEVPTAFILLLKYQSFWIDNRLYYPCLLISNLLYAPTYQLRVWGSQLKLLSFSWYVELRSARLDRGFWNSFVACQGNHMANANTCFFEHKYWTAGMAVNLWLKHENISVFELCYTKPVTIQQLMFAWGSLV